MNIKYRLKKDLPGVPADTLFSWTDSFLSGYQPEILGMSSDYNFSESDIEDTEWFEPVKQDAELLEFQVCEGRGQKGYWIETDSITNHETALALKNLVEKALELVVEATEFYDGKLIKDDRKLIEAVKAYKAYQEARKGER